MGVEVSRLGVGAGVRGCPPRNILNSGAEYPNLCRNESEASAWTLLHLCSLDTWKDVHDSAGFQESKLTCDGILHKDCSKSFCMNRQGFININKSSIFSFRKRSKFSHMAEHFEYNHIPAAQMSSINHFRVCGVVCFDDNLVVLHLSCNVTCQFGLLDLHANKFLGVFGTQATDISHDLISGQISPDKTKCLIAMPLVVETDNPQPQTQRRIVLRLYNLRTAALLSETSLDTDKCHFAFDPRFSWRRAAVTNFEAGMTNSLSVVSAETWKPLSTNRHATDEARAERGAGSALYPYLKDFQYTRTGSLIVATLLDNVCYCREKRSMPPGAGAGGNYRPVSASVYVFDGETADTLHCIQYRRFTCAIHSCPVNYRPIWSTCGQRMAIVMDTPSSSTVRHYIQVYKLPAPPSGALRSLQALCRLSILQSEYRNYSSSLPLPPRLIKYLQFKPEYDL